MNPNSCVTGSAGRKVFRYCNIASITVEDDGEPRTVNLCLNGYNLRQQEKITNNQWQAMEACGR